MDVPAATLLSFKEHAWKSDSFTPSNAQEHAPTQFPSTTSRNNDVLHDAPVSDGVHRGFRGVCDTVLTQSGFAFASTHASPYAVVPRGTPQRSIRFQP